MGKDLKYYQDLFDELNDEIKYLEKAYTVFEKVIIERNVTKSTRTSEEERIINEFKQLCYDNGFVKNGESLTKANFKNAKSAIQERVKFLRKQATNAIEMVALLEEQDNLNKGGIEAEVVKELEEKAAEKYDKDDEPVKYQEELTRLKKKYISDRKGEVKTSIEEKKESIEDEKVNNGIGEVVSNSFGPVGNFIHDTWAKIYNADLKHYKKKGVLNKVINVGAKVAAGALGLTVINAMALAGLAAVPTVLLSAGVVVLTARTIMRVVPKSAKPMELKGKAKSLKEALYRYNKVRGKGEKVKANDLYKGIDLSKYETKIDDKLDTPDDKKDDKVDTPDDKKDDKVDTPEDKKDDKVDTPDDKKGDKVDTPDDKKDDKLDTPEDKKDDKLDTPDDKKDDKLDTPDDKKDDKLDTPDDKKDDKKAHTVKYNQDDKDRLLMLRNAILLKKKMKSADGRLCSNYNDVKAAIQEYLEMLSDFESGKLKDAEIVTSKFYSLVNAREYLVKNGSSIKKDETGFIGERGYTELMDNCNNLLFGTPENVIALVNQNMVYRSMFTPSEKTFKKNQQEFHRDYLQIINMIQKNELSERLVQEVNSFKQKYEMYLTDELNNVLDRLLEDKEEKLRGSSK